MDTKTQLSPEEFNYVSGQGGLNAYAIRYGPSPQACPHMQGAAFYQLVDSPQARKCQRCEKMWYCSPACQKDLWPAHQADCVDQRSSLPITASGLGSSVYGHPPPMTDHSTTSFMVSAEEGSSSMAKMESQVGERFDLDVSNALLRGVVNRNAMGKRAAYDQLTPALVALLGRHAPASQRLIWCDTKSNDEATQKARKNFGILKSEWTDLMKYAHSKFISTRMRGAFVFNLDTPCGLGDWMLGKQRFNWLTYVDAQMTLCVKLQEVIRAYDPSRALVVVMYALSPDGLSAALWVWTYTDRARGDAPALMDLRIQIRRIMKDTKRAEGHMYSINKDQNDT